MVLFWKLILQYVSIIGKETTLMSQNTKIKITQVPQKEVWVENNLRIENWERSYRQLARFLSVFTFPFQVQKCNVRHILEAENGRKLGVLKMYFLKI